MNMVKRKCKTLQDLEKINQKHSKVNILKHNELKMRQDDCKEIFKLRCQVKGTRIHMRGIYDNHECEGCGQENDNKMWFYLEDEQILLIAKHSCGRNFQSLSKGN